MFENGGAHIPGARSTWRRTKHTKHLRETRCCKLYRYPLHVREINRYGGQDRHARGWTSGVRKWKHTRGYVSGVRKVTVDLDQENLLSSDLVAAMICVMALNLVFLAAGMLLGQVIEY